MNVKEKPGVVLARRDGRILQARKLRPVPVILSTLLTA